MIHAQGSEDWDSERVFLDGHGICWFLIGGAIIVGWLGGVVWFVGCDDLDW